MCTHFVAAKQFYCAKSLYLFFTSIEVLYVPYFIYFSYIHGKLGMREFVVSFISLLIVLYELYCILKTVVIK